MSNGDEAPEDALDDDADASDGETPEETREEAPEEAAEEAPEGADDDETPAVEGPGVDGHVATAREAIEGDEVGEEELEAALEAIENAVETAETEADLDEVADAVDDVEAAIEDADLPEPDEDDEEAEDPREVFESRVADLRDAIEDARGPYAEDVIEQVEEARTTLTDTRWTETGEAEATAAVESFLESVNDAIGTDVETAGDDPADLDAGLEQVAAAIEAEDLDADDDAGTIAKLVEAADELTTDLEDAEAWEDLTTREQLEAQGFYDVLSHRKDYPPEWSALKEHEKRGNADMVLLALENLGSEFMEEHCLDALRRMAPEEAVDPMMERAGRRDKDGIEILGKIGAEAAIDTIAEYVETDSDPQLQKTTLKALGEIGSEEATQAVANALVAENPSVRSHAARALGMIGDTRAIDPLADVLEDDDEDTVRASAAWALVQIGTEDALDAASGYADDANYLVAAEAEKAAEALGAKPA